MKLAIYLVGFVLIAWASLRRRRDGTILTEETQAELRRRFQDVDGTDTRNLGEAHPFVEVSYRTFPTPWRDGAGSLKNGWN